MNSRPTIRIAPRNQFRFIPRFEQCEDRTTPTPVVSITSLGSVPEGGFASAEVTRSDTSGTLSVSGTFDGTATAGSDYWSFGGFTAMFTDGSATVIVQLSTIDDADYEPIESIIFTISSDPNYTVGTPSSATIDLIDNDVAPPAPSVSVSLLEDAIEGEGSGSFRLVRTGDLTASFQVNYTLGGTATSGADYATPFSAWFMPNQSVLDIQINPTANDPPESTENVMLTVDVGSGYSVGLNGTVLMQIVDAAGAPFRPTGSGTGLFGRYYNTPDLYDLKTARTDAQIKFGHLWGVNAPMGTSVGADNFSVMWVGKVQAQLTDTYTFKTSSDDGVRVWIDGQLVINNWTDHQPFDNETIPGIALEAGKLYDIRVEYYERTGAAVIDLLWKSALFPVYRFVPQAQLYPIAFDLDVNANGNITDNVDGANDYLPGYEGTVQKVSLGNSFNTDTYTAQRMKLVLDGVGLNNANVTRVDFAIPTVSWITGYASNKNGPVIGENVDEDYSFYQSHDTSLVSAQRVMSITRTSGEGYESGGPVGGQMEANKTWINFYAKDYGGSARVEARVYVQDGLGGEMLAYTLNLLLPRDTDMDGLADKWEIQMGKRWNAQYHDAPLSVTAALAKFNAISTTDGEEKDPDGTQLIPIGTAPYVIDLYPRVEQAETGDAHTVLEEYRGYILDGGGLTGVGPNPYAGGHIRLNPARKEILVEVDRAAVLNNVPGAGTLDQNLAVILDGAASVYSNATRGAGIYMYYLMDQTALNLPKVDVDTHQDLRDRLGETRSATLQTDFLHLLIVNEADVVVIGSSAITYTTIHTAIATKRGSVLATTDTHNTFNSITFPQRADLFGTTIAHELTHQLIEKRTGEFTGGEHTTNPDKNDPAGGPLDRSCLMFNGSFRANNEYATVKFFAVVQQEITTKSSQGLVQ